jgi:hypothetical protein
MGRIDGRRRWRSAGTGRWQEGGKHCNVGRAGRLAGSASCNNSGGGATLNFIIASGQSVSVRINNVNTIASC